MNYQIGAKYKYRHSKDIFVLEEVNGFVFHFKCGHWCTDTVFCDLIDTRTGIPVYQNNQLEVFNHKE